jgi:hypothetical protein
MTKLSEYLEPAAKVILAIILVTPIYAYLSFYMVYPVICILPIAPFGALLGLYLLYSFLIGVGIGMVVEPLEHGFAVIMVSSILGYIIALVFYQGFPALLYGYSIYLSDVMMFQFISFSWLLLLIFILFGLPGLIVGGALADRYGFTE